MKNFLIAFLLAASAIQANAMQSNLSCNLIASLEDEQNFTVIEKVNSKWEKISGSPSLYGTNIAFEAPIDGMQAFISATADVHLTDVTITGIIQNQLNQTLSSTSTNGQQINTEIRFPNVKDVKGNDVNKLRVVCEVK